MDRPPPERIDSYPYRYRVADVMSQPPITAAPTLTLADAARRMREAGISVRQFPDRTGARRPEARRVAAADLGGARHGAVRWQHGVGYPRPPLRRIAQIDWTVRDSLASG
jgi:CBS domain-containing protein